MSTHSPAPLELERIPLPPIPGPLPHAFFTETPQKPLAVFSTHLSTRPFRNLPNPVPPHVFRSADHEDITRKAWSLLHTYPEVAESIFTPPAAWSDLYHYFDAMDLWTEGAGFLFHVLGFIVRVNWTRFNCLRVYADQWALTHEMRLIDMPKLQPHLLNSVFTAEDDMWFDVGSLTPYQKNALTVVLNSHRDVLRARHDSLLVDRRRKADYGGREIQRPDNTQSSEPHQDNERSVTPSFKPISQRLSGASPPFIPTKVTTQKETKSDQYIARSRSYSENEYPSCAYSKPLSLMRDIVPASKIDLSGNYADRRGFYPGSFSQDLPGPHRGLRNSHISDPSQTHFQQGTGPVYIFNGQKPTTGTKNETASLSGRPSITLHPAYHVPQQTQMCVQEKSPPDILMNTRRSYTARGVSNDARVYYDDEFARRHDEGARLRNQNINKAIRSNVDQELGCTVFVGGLSDDALEKQIAKELLSKCGVIKNVKPLQGKGCCFIEFTSTDSALQAIHNFDKYVTDEGLTLKVQYPKPKGIKKPIESDTHHESRASAQKLDYNKTSPPSQQALGSGRRTTGCSPNSHSPPNSTPSTMNSSPPHTLPSKPQSQSFVRGYPTSTGFDSQINFVDKLIQTADGNRLPARLNGTIASLEECKNDQLDRNIYEPPNKPAYSCRKKKNYRRKSESPSSTPTRRPAKSLLNSPSEDSATSSSPQIGETLSKVDPLESKSRVVVFRSRSRDAEMVLNPKILRNPTEYADSDPTGLGEERSIPTPNYEVEVLASNEAKTLNTPDIHTDDNASVHLTKKCPHTAPKDALKTTSLKMTDVIESLPQSSLVSFKPTKPTNKRTSPNNNNNTKLGKTSKANIKAVTHLSNAAAQNPPVEDNTKQSSEGSLEFCLKTKSSQKALVTGSYHDVSLAADKLRRSSDLDAKSNTCPQNTTQEVLTPPNAHSRQKAKKGKQPIPSKASSGEAIFSDCTSKAAHGRQRLDEASLVKFPTSTSPRSSIQNAKSGGKKIEKQARDESPTPKVSRRKLSEINGNSFERKENMQPPPLTRLFLSDLEQWPALGSSKVRVDLKPTKPLVDRTLQSAPTRRDSLASVVSSVSPRTSRRSTATATSPVGSVGSPLWPVVKRWDSYKTILN